MKLTPFFAALLLFVCCLSASADVVIEWNDAANDALAANVDKHNPGMTSRTLAMMNLAIHDSFKMGQPGGQTFYSYGQGASGSYSSAAAAAHAAYTVLNSIYPAQQSSFSTRLSATMSSIADGPDKTAGITVGTMIGQSIVARRANDGFNVNQQYAPSNAPGHWRPDPINPTQEAWGPGWGNLQTFAIQSPAQFTVPAPPALDSQAYADSFNQVKELGALNSTTRTGDQTEIGIFWAYDRVGTGSPMRLFNKSMMTIAQQQGNTELQNAELFAKAAVAVADAGIVAWDSKFEHDLWRPISGIREADIDGNPLTEADELWIPLGAPGGEGNDFTPPFPAYLSGHATFGGAMFETLKEFYGTDDVAYTLYSEELGGLGRDFTSFTQAMEENSMSRVYLGVHWDFDSIVGQATGQDVARYINGRQFVAVPEPSGLAMLIAVTAAALRCRFRRR